MENVRNFGKLLTIRLQPDSFHEMMHFELNITNLRQFILHSNTHTHEKHWNCNNKYAPQLPKLTPEDVHLTEFKWILSSHKTSSVSRHTISKSKRCKVMTFIYIQLKSVHNILFKYLTWHFVSASVVASTNVSAHFWKQSQTELNRQNIRTNEHFHRPNHTKRCICHKHLIASDKLNVVHV